MVLQSSLCEIHCKKKKKLLSEFKGPHGFHVFSSDEMIQNTESCSEFMWTFVTERDRHGGGAEEFASVYFLFVFFRYFLLGIGMGILCLFNLIYTIVNCCKSHIKIFIALFITV